MAFCSSTAPEEGERRGDEDRRQAHVRIEADDRDDQRRNAGDGQPMPSIEVFDIRLRGSGVSLASAKELQAAEQHEAANAHDRVRQHVVPVGLPLEAAEADARHHVIGDDAARRERRQRARQRAIASHERHQQRRYAHPPRDGHGGRRQQGAGRCATRTDRRHDHAQCEKHDGQQPRVPAAKPDGPPGQPGQRAVGVGHAEQQRHADERDQQRHGKARQDGIDRHSAQIHPHQPGHGQREDADIDRREDAQRDGQDERPDRDPRERHCATAATAALKTRESWLTSDRSSSASTMLTVSSIADGGSTSDAQSLNFSWSSSRVNGRSGPPR